LRPSKSRPTKRQDHQDGTCEYGNRGHGGFDLANAYSLEHFRRWRVTLILLGNYIIERFGSAKIMITERRNAK
jgi:hypothetical protein